MLNALKEFCIGNGVNLKDSAILIWPMGRKRPVTQQLNGISNPDALSGAFWGMLFGMIFFIPDLGMAVAAAMGALAGKFSDYGFDRTTLQRIRDSISEESSALFVMTSDTSLEKITAEIQKKGMQFDIISTNLSEKQELKLEDDFGV